ncbi:MAG: hypothetical protein DRI61_03110 [Chloroflexi bacterium]|nr:MAG: hypothetical protein DRI61_03110 [Chloroflexota bacterium]
MILIVCDSLRYDYAEKYLFGWLFSEETTAKIHTLDTRTPLNLPTMFTGLPKEKHEVRYPWDEVKYDRCLFDYFKNTITISRYLGWRREYPDSCKLMGAQSRTKDADRPHLYHPLPFNPVSMNDNDIFEFVCTNEKTKQWDLILYWSWITHYPYGIANLTSETCPAIKHEERLLKRLSNKQRHEWYLQGVEEMGDRIRSIANMTNDIIIVTADHGEALGEDGIFGHPRIGEGGKLYPPLAEVPFIVNRDVDIPKEFMQTEFMDIVVKISGKDAS